jgi:hypothetical protein
MRPAIAPLAVMVAAGCYSYRAAPVPLPVNAPVRVRFESPRTLAMLVPSGDTVNVGSVAAVVGRVIAARRDTLVLAVTSVWGQGKRVDGIPGGSRAVVVPDPARPAEQARVSAGRTLLMLAAVAAAGAVVVLAVFLHALSDPNY